MFLAFDTETTGLPKWPHAPASQVERWPRVVQLAWEFFDLCGRRVLARSDVVRPDGFTIPKDAEVVHGISDDLAHRRGLPIADVLDALTLPVSAASVLVAHNLEFDAKIVGAEFHRLGRRDPIPDKPHACTMLASTDYCALPSRYGPKWPRLPELHLKLFGNRVEEAHDAAADVAVCSKCFVELTRLGVVRVPSLEKTTCDDCRRALSLLGVACASPGRLLTRR